VRLAASGRTYERKIIMEIIAVSAVVGAVAFGLGIACGRSSPCVHAVYASWSSSQFIHSATPHNLHTFDFAGGISVCSPDGGAAVTQGTSTSLLYPSLFRVRTCQHPVSLRSPLACWRLLLGRAPSSIVPIHVTTPSIAPLRMLAMSRFC
jgi:hypothetical protein